MSETDEEKAAREAQEAEAAKQKETEKKPPWGSDEDFNPERAWKLIQDLREDNGKLKTERDEARTKVKEHEDSTKTEQERLAEKAAADEARATSATLEAARLRIALKKGLTETQAKRLVGETAEELEQDADELLADFGSKDDDEEQSTTRRRPQEHLRPGTLPAAKPEESDPAKLAAAVPRGGI